MTYHPDVLAAHAEFGGDLEAMQALYDRPDHISRIAELAAENARMRKDLHSYEMTMKAIEEADRIERSEALSRTGAVKVNREELAQSVVNLICDDVLPAYGVDGEIARQDPELFSAALSALEPAAPEGEQAAEYHDAAEAKPYSKGASEGEQEACGSCGYTADPDCPICSPATAACPSEQGATEAGRDVLAERRRQVEAEGWTPEHDDQYDNGELSRAAAAYAHHSTRPKDRRHSMAEVGAWPSYWPWDVKWWKPTEPRRDLVKAGALILAEIERLDRAALKAAMEAGGQHG